MPIPLVPIVTDGTYFLERIRAHLSDRCGIVREEAFDKCLAFLPKTINAHKQLVQKYFKFKRPLYPFLLSYQDGLIHGLKRIADRHFSGEYHNKPHLFRLLHGYEHKVAEYRNKKDLWNENYARGYQEAMLYLILCDENEDPPCPPIFGAYHTYEFRSMAALNRFPKDKIKKYHLKQSKTIYDRCQNGNEMMIPQHIPYV